MRGQQQREEYVSILNAFIDKKDSYYSLHQIGKQVSWSWLTYVSRCGDNRLSCFPVAAQMGVGEGKSIGQWYGPNTVAQVLK